MIIVDKALAIRANNRRPIRVAIVGAGFSGRHIARHIIQSTPGIRLVALVNRTPQRAVDALASIGISDLRLCETTLELDGAVRRGTIAVTNDASLACRSSSVDAIIEATGTIEYGARVVVEALKHRKHVVLCNAELDATLGPILKVYADQAGVVYSNIDGDEPGVAMNLIRFVRGIGLRPVVAGNLKGLFDPYRTPDTQREFAKQYGQNPQAAASFADGTKLSMELAALANATGFQVAKPGMYGPRLCHVNETAAYYRDKLLPNGMVDFTVGAAPANGAFVLGHTDDSTQQAYLKYMKMGDGPLYTFYTPFHLPQLEAATTVARAVLLADATVAPLGAPVCDAISVAKRDLNAGETLDGLGGFTCYGRLVNYTDSRRYRALPIGLSESCRLLTQVAKDQAVSYDDVVLPEDRLCDQLRIEQDDRFFAPHISSARPALMCTDSLPSESIKSHEFGHHGIHLF